MCVVVVMVGRADGGDVGETMCREAKAVAGRWKGDVIKVGMKVGDGVMMMGEMKWRCDKSGDGELKSKMIKITI